MELRSIVLTPAVALTEHHYLLNTVNMKNTKPGPEWASPCAEEHIPFFACLHLQVKLYSQQTKNITCWACIINVSVFLRCKCMVPV